MFVYPIPLLGSDPTEMHTYVYQKTNTNVHSTPQNSSKLPKWSFSIKRTGKLQYVHMWNIIHKMNYLCLHTELDEFHKPEFEWKKLDARNQYCFYIKYKAGKTGKSRWWLLLGSGGWPVTGRGTFGVLVMFYVLIRGMDTQNVEFMNINGVIHLWYVHLSMHIMPELKIEIKPKNRYAKCNDEAHHGKRVFRYRMAPFLFKMLGRSRSLFPVHSLPGYFVIFGKVLQK